MGGDGDGRNGGVDFDLIPGLPVDALTTAVLLQPPPQAAAQQQQQASASAGAPAAAQASESSFFFPAWPPPATPDNLPRRAIPLGRVTARATLAPSLDAALPEAASGLLSSSEAATRRKKKSGGGSAAASSSSLSTSSEDDSDSDGERREERRQQQPPSPSPPSFPRRARDCKLPGDLDREWRQQRDARRAVAAAAATGAANGMDVDNVARTPERAAGKKAAAGVGGASVGKRRVVDSDDSD